MAKVVLAKEFWRAEYNDEKSLSPCRITEGKYIRKISKAARKCLAGLNCKRTDEIEEEIAQEFKQGKKIIRDPELYLEEKWQRVIGVGSNLTTGNAEKKSRFFRIRGIVDNYFKEKTSSLSSCEMPEEVTLLLSLKQLINKSCDFF